MFGASSGLFFLFFVVPANVFVYVISRSWLKNMRFTRVLDPPSAWNIGIYSAL